MILLHQIWNQRRQNLWIFIELLIAGFFLWMVIDPIYVLTANRLIPQGGDTRGMYVLNLMTRASASTIPRRTPRR